MSEEIQSRFSALYKNVGIQQESDIKKQEIRRQKLLDEQKCLRAAQHDDFRHLDDFVEKLHKKKSHRNHRRRKCIDENPVQLSEWMKGRPEDLDEWFLVPCPKGQRCLVVATKGKTELYNKHGFLFRSLHTNLPGDQHAKHQVTILDAILDKNTNRLFVLDMTAYGSQDMANCDTQFRFYWVSTKIAECEAHQDSDLQLVALPHYDMADELSAASCFERFPQFEDNTPEMDGFLFYHKDASYTYGSTPLVLWLFAFMIPEVLGYNIHPTYMMSRPSEYIDYLHFIQEFDASMLQKKAKMKRRHQRRISDRKMDEDPENVSDFQNGDMNEVECDDLDDENCELEAIIDQERKLELEIR